METSLKTVDYYINHCGTVIEIGSLYDGLLILFVSGSGYGDQCMGDCSFSSSYAVYEADSLKKTLTLCGTLNESCGRSDAKSYKRFSGVIKGQEIKLDGFVADKVFKKIFAKKED